MNESPITTRVLDLSRGRPAQGMKVVLENPSGPEAWSVLGSTMTDLDGRADDLLFSLAIKPGLYRLRFDSGSYFRKQKLATFYPEIVIVFEIDDSSSNYHLPLLISPFGYSTYRES